MNDIIIINKLICQSSFAGDFRMLLLQLAAIYHRAMAIYPIYTALYKDFNAHDVLEYLALHMYKGIASGNLAIYTAVPGPSAEIGTSNSLPIGFISIHSRNRSESSKGSGMELSLKQRWINWRRERQLDKQIFNPSDKLAYHKAARVLQVLTATIIHFAVDSEHQKQGVGSMLIEKMLEDYEKCAIQVVATSSSRNVFNKHGFSLQQVEDLNATAIYKMLRAKR